MRRITCTLGVLLAILSLTVGCNPLELLQGLPSELTLTEADNGRSIDLPQGRTLAIKLEANPSTGYTWEVAELNPPILRQEGAVEFKPNSTLIGAPGTMTFRFKAINTGNTTLELIYHRPWEQDVAPLKTFTLQVSVR